MFSSVTKRALPKIARVPVNSATVRFTARINARTFTSSAKENAQKKGGKFLFSPQVSGKSRYLLLLGIPAAYVSVASCEPKVVTPVEVVEVYPEPEIIIKEPAGQVQVQDRLGRISLGFLMGFCGGYAAKQIGKIVLVAVGTFFLIIQFMAYRGYVTVNWSAVANKATPVTDPVVRRRTFKTIIAILTHNLLLKTGFVSGLVAGFKLG